MNIDLRTESLLIFAGTPRIRRFKNVAEPESKKEMAPVPVHNR